MAQSIRTGLWGSFRFVLFLYSRYSCQKRILPFLRYYSKCILAKMLFTGETASPMNKRVQLRQRGTECTQNDAESHLKLSRTASMDILLWLTALIGWKMELWTNEIAANCFQKKCICPYGMSTWGCVIEAVTWDKWNEGCRIWNCTYTYTYTHTMHVYV